MNFRPKSVLEQEQGVIEIVLVGVIAIGMAIGGFYLYTDYQNKQSLQRRTEATQKLERARAALKKTQADKANKANDAIAKEIAAKVLAFYQAYAGPGLGGTSPRKTVEQLSTEGYLTTDAVAAIKNQRGIDPFLCSPGGPGKPFNVDRPSINKETAMVVVSQETASGGNRIRVELKKLEGSWKIDKGSCLSSSTTTKP